MNDVSRKLGDIMIEYEDENPAIRTLYEPECAGHGVQVNMRPSQGTETSITFHQSWTPVTCCSSSINLPVPVTW